jgi:hypothetical protein
MPQTSSREQNLRLILALIWIGLTTIFVIYDISKNWWPARQVIDWQIEHFDGYYPKTTVAILWIFLQIICFPILIIIGKCLDKFFKKQ